MHTRADGLVFNTVHRFLEITNFPRYAVGGVQAAGGRSGGVGWGGLGRVLCTPDHLAEAQIFFLLSSFSYQI